MSTATLGHITVDEARVPVVTTTTLVIGTGSAGYCAAERLAGFGAGDVVMIKGSNGSRMGPLVAAMRKAFASPQGATA